MAPPLDSALHKRPHAATVAALTLLWLCATAWLRPLSLPDEGRYAGVAWEMLRSGDWLTPTLNGLPFFHKPPLFYWLTAGAMRVFGPSQLAARAAPITGGLLAGLSLYLFTRRWWNARAARLALLALLTQPLLFVGAQYANLDMLVAGCIATTITLLAHAALCIEGGLPHRRALAAGFALAGVGVLAKGLIGIVLPALVVGGWLVTRRRWAILVRMLAWWPGHVLMALVAVPWFVVMQSRFPGFLHYFFVVQHFQRFAGGGFNNVQPFWFYPAVLLLLSLPCLPWLTWPGRSALLAEAGAAQRGLRSLLLLWVAAVLLFFSVPQSKLVGYILPVLPALALLMVDAYLANSTAAQRQPKGRRWWWAGSLVLSALVSVAAVVVAAFHPGVRSNHALGQVLKQHRGGEPVFMFGTYAYDVPLYAGLTTPVTLAGDWSDPQLVQRDDWRREVADAAGFDRAAAARSLIETSALGAALCQAPVSWVIGADADSAGQPYLAQATRVASHRGTTLWRVPRALPALACPAPR